MRDKTGTLVSRRMATQTFLALLGGAVLVRCGGDPATAASDGADGGGGGTTGSGGEGGAADAGADAATKGDATGSAGAWATGGTAAMVDAASYPDPFTSAATGCVLALAATEGPCTEAADQVRKDISEGYAGLPMRLALQVVDASCNPIAGATVKVWHTQRTGSYSGDTPNNGMCLELAADSAKHYFRGVQTTDASGRVDFDSCFPGWYRSRVVHVHFTVTAGGKSFTSQLVFDDALVAEIFASHAEYKEFGQPDTTSSTDNVVKASPSSYVLAVARMTDGAMMASKRLVVPL